MRDVLSITVSLAWEKKKKRRVTRGDGTVGGGRRAEAIEEKVSKNDVVKVCKFGMVRFLARLSVSGSAS